MITEDYVSFETAKLLKEKGFEQEPDYATSWYANQYYKNSCQGEWFEGEHQIIEDINDKCNISYLSECGIFIPAPTLQIAMKWLRENFNINPVPYALSLGWAFDIFDLSNRDITGCKKLFSMDLPSKSECYNSYEQACEAAIKYCLENLI